MSQLEVITIDSMRQTGAFDLSRKKFVKDGIKYTLNTTESTSDICGYCVIEEIEYKQPENVDFISKRIITFKKNR